MLLVPIGRAGRLLTFDVAETHDCATCAAPRDFQLRLRYEWGTLFYLPVCVTERRYELACPACGHGWLVRRESGDALLGGDPVPWRHRNGWMLVAPIVLVGAVALARSCGSL